MGGIPYLIFPAIIQNRATAASPGTQVTISRKTEKILPGFEKVIDEKIYRIVRAQMKRTGLFTLPIN
jgi:hypothetical protein